MKDVIEKIKSFVRGTMNEIAKLLDQLTNGMIKPSHLTFLSLAGHVIVMLAITEGLFGRAAILLLSFGLLDALDGALARYQNSSTTFGMLLDSTTDRLKEMLIYAGFVYYFAILGDEIAALYAVLAMGMSFAVSYVKAKGEAAILQSQPKHVKGDPNRHFEDGIFGYEVRMAILVVALAVNQPEYGIIVVAAGALSTFLRRFRSVTNQLNVKN